MKTKHILSIVGIVLSLFISFFYSGCKKIEKEAEKKVDTTPARDNAESESIFSGIWKQVSEVSEHLSTSSGGCPKITLTPFDTTTWPKTIVIDYGTVNCLGFDGVNRRGIITAVFSGKYRTPGTTINIELTNFYHNNNLITGTQTITNSGLNSAGHLSYNVVVNNATVNTSKGIMTWNTNQTREWIAGEKTHYYTLDDVFLINGTSNGVCLNGNSYTIMVTLPLRVERNCRWIVSGVLTIQPQNHTALVLNYGLGTCDNDATVTVNGKIYPISLF